VKTYKYDKDVLTYMRKSIKSLLNELMESTSKDNYHVIYCSIDDIRCDEPCKNCNKCKKARDYNRVWLVERMKEGW
jgi:hypothetical protein